MTQRDKKFLESKPCLTGLNDEFQSQCDKLVKYINRYVLPNMTPKEKCIILGSLEIMRMNSSFIKEIINRQHITLSSETLDDIMKAIKFHIKSKDSVLRYSPLRTFYIMLSIVIVDPNTKLLKDSKFINKFKTLSTENNCFVSHNRNVVLSLLRLRESSTYWPCVKNFMDKYGK